MHCCVDTLLYIHSIHKSNMTNNTCSEGGYLETVFAGAGAEFWKRGVQLIRSPRKKRGGLALGGPMLKSLHHGPKGGAPDPMDQPQGVDCPLIVILL